jgi:hypothetical protein
MNIDALASEPRLRALEALNLMRHRNLSLTRAAAEVGTTVRTVRRHADAALERRGRRLVAKSSDRLARPMSVFTPDGPQTVIVRSSAKASVVAGHWAAIQKYLASGDTTALAKFTKQTVGGVRLGTDPNAIEAWARIGELAIDDIYAITA